MKKNIETNFNRENEFPEDSLEKLELELEEAESEFRKLYESEELLNADRARMKYLLQKIRLLRVEILNR